MRWTTAQRRYNWRVAWLSLAYGALLVATVYGFEHKLVPSALRYPVAILPALPIIAVFAAIGRYLIDERDEYIRMLMVRQTLWASGFALSVATAWGFLESFDLVRHADGYWVAVCWFFGLGIGGLVNRFAYGNTGSGC